MNKKKYTRAKRDPVLHHFAMDLLGVIADAKRTGQLDAICLETLERVSAGLHSAAVSTPASRETEAKMVCAEVYQAVGAMLDDLGVFNTPRADKILDNLAQCRRVHDDVLPWPSLLGQTEHRPAAWFVDGPKGHETVYRHEDIEPAIARMCAATGDDPTDYTATGLFLHPGALAAPTPKEPT